MLSLYSCRVSHQKKFRFGGRSASSVCKNVNIRIIIPSQLNFSKTTALYNNQITQDIEAAIGKI